MQTTTDFPQTRCYRILRIYTKDCIFTYIYYSTFSLICQELYCIIYVILCFLPCLPCLHHTYMRINSKFSSHLTLRICVYVATFFLPSVLFLLDLTLRICAIMCIRILCIQFHLFIYKTTLSRVFATCQNKNYAHFLDFRMLSHPEQ